MRIAVWHNLNSGGGKRALYDHVKGLIDRGHHVVSYCPDTVDQSYLPLSNLVEEKIFPLKSKIDRRINRFKLFRSSNNVKEKFSAELEHCEECAMDIKANNFDILFANSSTSFYVSHLGRFLDIPKIIYLGEPNRFLYESRGEFIWRAPESLNVYFLKYFYRRAKHLYYMFWYSLLVREEFTSARCYDLILVNSSFSRESVKRAYNLDSKVCYLGIDTEKFNIRNHKKEFFALGLGSIIPNKGIEQAIISLSMIEESMRPPLIWIGNINIGNYVNEIKQFAFENNVNMTLKILISDDELLDLLNKAAVLLYLPHLEPFGLAPLEANACGTAVIGINEGGIKETIINGINGFTVKDFDPKKIAAHIKEFVSDLTYAENFGKKSRSHIVENWNLENGINNLEGLIQQLMKNKSLM